MDYTLYMVQLHDKRLLQKTFNREKTVKMVVNEPACADQPDLGDNQLFIGV